MKYSFDKYCALCDKYEDYTYICDDWFPSVEESNYLIEHIKEEFDYIVWILETASDNIRTEFAEEYNYLQSSFEEVVEFT